MVQEHCTSLAFGFLLASEEDWGMQHQETIYHVSIGKKRRTTFWRLISFLFGAAAMDMHG